MRVLALALALFSGASYATKITMTGSSTLIPENSTIYSLDTETGEQTTLLDVAKPNENLAAYSGAVVCNGTYYSVFANPPSDYGIYSVDLVSNKFLARTLTTNFLWHKITCDPTDETKLVGVSSNVGGEFSISKYDTVTQEATVVAPFPTDNHMVWNGYDTQFQFDSPTQPTSLYISWANDAVITSGGRAGGTLLELDLQTGAQLSTFQYAHRKPQNGQPYFVVPSTLSATDNTMAGVMWYYVHGVTELKWGTLALPKTDGGEIDFTITSDVTSAVWSSSSPQVVCNDGYLYSFSGSNTGTKSVSQMDVKTGALVKSFDLKLQTEQTYGALACNE